MKKRVLIFMCLFIATISLGAQNTFGESVIQLNLFNYSNYYDDLPHYSLTARYDNFISDGTLFHLAGGIGMIDALYGWVPELETGIALLIAGENGSGEYGIGGYYEHGDEGTYFTAFGTSEYWTAHLFEISIKDQLMFYYKEDLDYGTSLTTTEIFRNDIIAKAGYRYMSVYSDAFMPMQEFIIGAYALAAFRGANASVVEVDDYWGNVLNSSTEGTIPYGLTFGATVEFAWYFIHGSLTYLDERLSFNFGLNMRFKESMF